MFKLVEGKNHLQGNLLSNLCLHLSSFISKFQLFITVLQLRYRKTLTPLSQNIDLLSHDFEVLDQNFDFSYSFNYFLIFSLSVTKF